MKLNDYYFHGLQNINVLKSIIKDGLLSREELRKKSKDTFSSSKDFISDEGTNGFNTICVCTYKSLSYYLFSLPNISLIIEKDSNYDIEAGGLDGEYLIKNKIPKEKIKAIGIRLYSSNKYNKKLYDYILDIKNNINYIKKYPIINIENGTLVEDKDLNKLFEYLNINKSINILIEGTVFSGKKDIINELGKKYKIYEKDDLLISDKFEYKKKMFIKRYNNELNNKDIVIYKDSLLDYKKLFNKEEWNSILKELNTNEKELCNYDIIIHLYSMVNKYKYIYDKMPKELDNICLEDERIDKKWNKNSNYYRIYAKDSIREKLDEVIKVIEKYL